MICLASVSDTLKLWTSGDSAAADLVAKNYYESATDTNFHSVAWNHTNQVVAIGGSEPKVHLIQVKNGQLLSSLVLSESKLSHFQVKAVAFSHNSRYLACSMGSPIQVWDLKRRQIKSVFTGHTHSIESLSFLPSGDVFAADAMGRIKLWSLKSTSPVHELSDKDDSKHLTCMAVSPISSVLSAGYMDGSLRIWDAVNHTSPNTLLRSQVCHQGKVSGIACSPKNSRLVSTVGLDGKLVLIDTGSRAANDICAVSETGEVLTSLAFHEDGIHSAVGTIEGNILLYDWRNLRHPVVNLPAHSPNPVNALAYQVAAKGKDSASHAPETPSTNSIATGRTDKTDRIVAATSTPRKSGAHDTSANDLFLELPPPAPTQGSSAAVQEMKPFPKPHEESAMNSGTYPPPSPAPRASELLDNSFVSSFNHRLQTHIAVGGHATSTSNNNSFISTTSHRPVNTDEGRTEAAPDLAYAHSKLYTDVDRALNRSFASTASKPPAGGDMEFGDLRQAVRPVSAKDLEEALEVLKYDIHNEVQEIIKEQVRQFVIAKDETAQMIQELSTQLADLIRANKELREENDRLRRIY